MYGESRRRAEAADIDRALTEYGPINRNVQQKPYRVIPGTPIVQKTAETWDFTADDLGFAAQ